MTARDNTIRRARIVCAILAIGVLAQTHTPAAHRRISGSIPRERISPSLLTRLAIRARVANSISLRDVSPSISIILTEAT